MKYQALMNECDDISAECDRLQDALKDWKSHFHDFESRLNAVDQPTQYMIQEFVELKKQHLRTRWMQLKILHRRRRLKEQIMLFKLSSLPRT